MLTEKKYRDCQVEFWGGIECTINRVHDLYHDQLSLSGHYQREGDIKLIAALGIKVLRYPILWEKHEPFYNGKIDWDFTQNKLDELKKYGITPIAGLLHHGSGPSYTSLLDNNFPELFASYAAKVAQQFPWLEYYTPINEPLTTARFSGLYGLWYPHITNDVSFAKMLINQVRGIVLAMKEIRKINPEAKLIQTEDLSKTYSTPSLKYQAAFENERRWLTYDMLCGKLRPEHAMWNYFLRLGIKEEALNFFKENALPPDIMGLNYYITSERYLDDDLKKYPPHTYGGNEIQEYADIEAIRVNHGNPSGLKLLLQEAWQRYNLPIAITEAHLNAGREDQLRWLNEIYHTCYKALYAGINIKAITFWSLFGAYGWNNLLTGQPMDYEPGAYDLRSVVPRPTAIAAFIKNIIEANKYDHTLTLQKGWWHHPNRFYKSEMPNKNLPLPLRGRPLIITGKTGTLGQAFAKLCDERNLDYLLTGRDTFNISDEKNIETFLDEHNPWAVINTAGFVRVDEAERLREECFEVNAIAPALLSRLCKKRNISFLTFSTDLVFDGSKDEPYLESDPTNPLNIYGASKSLSEEKILAENPQALIVRTSSFFGPWDTHNFVFYVLKSLSKDEKLTAADDVIISPTYVPHLTTASLELLIDGECGIWHLANPGAVSWKQFAVKIARRAGYDTGLISGNKISDMNLKATRPKNSALSSQRGSLLPSLDFAVDCFFNECISLPTTVLKHQHKQTYL
ncbi:MAG: sugar nucleotide-binding protein [Bacteroidota bacterium]|nr:sugar nucleotide-binding protein [Bacteroidota bacterium]